MDCACGCGVEFEERRGGSSQRFASQACRERYHFEARRRGIALDEALDELANDPTLTEAVRRLRETLYR